MERGHLQNHVGSDLAKRIGTAARVSVRVLRSKVMGFALAAVAVTTVAGLLLVALPTKQVAGDQLPTFAPLTPQADAHISQDALALDSPFQVQFTKPMNEASVESALAIVPQTDVTLQWDATSQVLSIAPVSHWVPNTNYTIDIANTATDQEGLSLAAIHATFSSGANTSGTIAATLVVADLTAPNSAFQVTFSRPVKLSTVVTRLSITPQVDVTIAGDDPTDTASQVFTMTPKQPLGESTTYVVNFAGGGTDAAGAALQPVAPITITTMSSPAVLKFRPASGTVVYDTNQVVSVRFTTPMDEKATQAAFFVTVGGRAVAGSYYWTENDTVLSLTPRYSFKVGSTVVARVSTAARSATGMHIPAAQSVTFAVSKAKTYTIVRSGGGGGGGGSTAGEGQGTGAFGSVGAQYGGLESYYLGLMNCTRTGGWLTSSGACSSESHHTLPAQNALYLDSTISLKVARPYARYLADHNLLTHNGGGTSAPSRFRAAGYYGYVWGENIASPHRGGEGGMIDSQLYFQSEAACRCEHYKNLMNGYFHRVGIGLWFSASIRLVIDFYS
jgi:uncharacterized protein YkwD